MGSNPTSGTVWLEGATWCLNVAPHVARRVRALFAVATQFGVVRVPDTPSNAEDLEWVFARYPVKFCKPAHADRLRKSADANRRSRVKADEITISQNALPYGFDLELPLRDYQKQFVALAQTKRRLLNGDSVGLGKTSQAIGLIAFVRERPAVVVCHVHLQEQWVNEVAKFAPFMACHIIRNTKHDYRLPDADVYVITYHKLAAWADRLAKLAKIIVFDEGQELRRYESQKYAAAKHISKACTYAISLTATPVYNYGDEAFNVIDAINPGCLGTRQEFLGEWCRGWGTHHLVDDPIALGAYLREQHLMIRRTREEVGRELPEVDKIVQGVAYEPAALDALRDNDGLFLARQILEGTFGASGQAARLLDIKLRQATGIAKAGAVADFVAEMNANTPTKIVLAAWHREVYTVIQDRLDKRGVKHRMYTGSESPAQKRASFDAFRGDEADVLLLSNRSGVGLDGLQEVCNIVVFAELDWSGQVHDQIIGRLRRDGQRNQVTAFFLIANIGSDPVLCNLLGLKDTQSAGIVDMIDRAEDDPETFGRFAKAPGDDNLTRLKQLAKAYLEQNHKTP